MLSSCALTAALKELTDKLLDLPVALYEKTSAKIDVKMMIIERFILYVYGLLP